MDVDRPGVAIVVVAPDPVEQLAPGVGAAGMSGQHGQELVLLGSDVDDRTVPTEIVGDGVEHHTVCDADMVISAQARLLVQEGESCRDLAWVGVGRQGFIEAQTKRLDPCVQVARLVQQERPEPRPPPPFADDEVHLTVAGWWRDEDDPEDPAANELRAEQVSVAGHAQSVTLEGIDDLRETVRSYEGDPRWRGQRGHGATLGPGR